MREWWVNLQGDDFDLAQLSALLKDPIRRVRQEEGRYFLTADRLNNLENADEVRAAAKAITASFNGLVRLQFNSRTRISVGNMEERIENGETKNLYVMPESTSLWMREGAVGVVITEGGTDKTAPQQENPFATWLSLAETDQKIAQVLEMYGNASPSEPWKDLYPIFEIIRADVGGEDGLVSKGWINITQISRFRHTANHPEAAGEGARHGVSTYDPPKNPMTIAEAGVFIKSLLRAIMLYLTPILKLAIIPPYNGGSHDDQTDNDTHRTDGALFHRRGLQAIPAREALAEWRGVSPLPQQESVYTEGPPVSLGL